MLLPGHARAQEPGSDPAASARFHWGALHFTPSLAITNVGVDTNVFNDTADQQKDNTAAIGPVVDLWMRAGRARISARTGGQYLYFREFSNQRAWNTDNQVRVDVPSEHITPFAQIFYNNSRTRSGYEIDTRERQIARAFVAGADVPLSARTTLSISEGRSTLAFDREDLQSAILSEQLDRTTDTTQAQLRYRMTPLTTFVVDTNFIRDRFTNDAERDADSVRVIPGFLFKPFALISGKAGIGFRHLDGVHDSLPDYDGLIASVGVSYHIAATQVSVDWNRDLAYSALVVNPYYTLNDVQLTVMQRITQTWDVVGRGGWQALVYQRDTSLPPAPEESDHLRQYGAGVGYRVGRTLRLGFDTFYSTRRSYDQGRDYEGLRAGFSVNYGL